MDSRPSRDIDARARARAAKRYRQVGDDWVKGKEVEGAWVPENASKKFASLPEAVDHEMSLTKQRRTSWTNLIKGQTTAIKKHVKADGEVTRAEVRAGLAPLAQLLGPDEETATAAQLRLRKRSANELFNAKIKDKVEEEKRDREAKKAKAKAKGKSKQIQVDRLLGAAPSAVEGEAVGSAFAGKEAGSAAPENMSRAAEKATVPSTRIIYMYVKKNNCFTMPPITMDVWMWMDGCGVSGRLLSLKPI